MLAVTFSFIRHSLTEDVPNDNLCNTLILKVIENVNNYTYLSAMPMFCKATSCTWESRGALSLLLSVRDVQQFNNYLFEELGHNAICCTTKYDSLSHRGFVRLMINHGMEFYVKFTNTCILTQATYISCIAWKNFTHWFTSHLQATYKIVRVFFGNSQLGI